MPRILLFLLLVLPLGACQSASSVTPDLIATWGDIPIPRGFDPAQSEGDLVPIDAGTYRAGDFHYLGRGSEAKVLAYYQERLPLNGWTASGEKNTWRKGDTLLEVVVSDFNSKGNDAFGLLALTLHVRTRATDTPTR